MNKKKKTVEKKSSHTHTLKGVLDISRSGMGYVIVEGLEKDIMIRPNDFNRAFHGDTVSVQVNKHTMPGKRVEGKVVDVVQRKQTDFLGTVQINRDIAFFIPAGKKACPIFL